MNLMFAILVFGLCLWVVLSALGILTLRIIGNVLDMLYPPNDEGQR